MKDNFAKMYEVIMETKTEHGFKIPTTITHLDLLHSKWNRARTTKEFQEDVIRFYKHVKAER